MMRAARNRVAAGKQAVPNQVRNEGLLSHHEKSFGGFMGFVIKKANHSLKSQRQHNNSTINIST